MSRLPVGTFEIILSIPVYNPDVRVVEKVRGYGVSAAVRDLFLPEVHRLRRGHCERAFADRVLLRFLLSTARRRWMHCFLLRHWAGLSQGRYGRALLPG